MKQPWEWDEDDILSLIKEQVKESISLDYKQCDSLGHTDRKKDEISKDVSAFANSAGGTIVYGIIENGHVPVAIDIGYDPNDISKEWLEQVINSRIHRRIDGIRINQVDLPNEQPGKVLYVVYIPQSNRAPHMASDHRFYKRFNFEDEEPWSKPVGLRVFMTNDSPTATEYALVQLFIDSDLKVVQTRGLRQEGESQVTIGEQTVSVQRFRKTLSIPRTLPIWQGVTFSLLDTPLLIALLQEPGDYILIWKAYAPQMPCKSGAYVLSSKGSSVSISELLITDIET
jgi:hypothetical protein